MSMQSDQLPSGVLEALQRGDMIDAIKLLRAATGLGLKESKDIIDEHLRGNPVSLTAGKHAVTLPPEVEAALQRGSKIEAIGLLREQTGLGLKEAKDAIDALSAERAASDALAPGEVRKSGGYGWLLAVLALAGVAAYYYFSRGAG